MSLVKIVSQPQVTPIQVKSAEHSSLQKLKAGNERYLNKVSGSGKDAAKGQEKELRRRLSTLGQNPWAIVVSCSDSRCPTERVFDADPGDLFVVRVAGNICGSPIGGVIGSAEYAVEHLRSPLIMVLGHTKCGAVSAAVSCCKMSVAPSDNFGRNLGAVVGNIRSPAMSALQSSERPETPMQIEEAIKLNVFHSMATMLKWSSVMQQAVRQQRVEIHGGIYDITTGEVSFLGKHPRQDEILAQSTEVIVRTGQDAPMRSIDAMLKLKLGNERYVIGDMESKIVDMKMRQALVQKGQRPFAIMLSCADSRIPLDYVFDTNPGDLFVVRNAGSVCGPMSGGLIGSIEYGVGHLKSQLIVVMGHTHCGAVSAAMEAHLAGARKGDDVPLALKCLLEHLKTPVRKAADQIPSKTTAEKVSLAIELSVWHTIEQLLTNSTVMQKAYADGILQIQGAVYDMQTGRVSFMGEHPQLNDFVEKVGASDVETMQLDWKRDVSNGTNGSKSTKATSKTGDSDLKATGIVPDVEKGVQKPAGWTKMEEEGESGKKDLKEFLPEFSWYVQTKLGRQHIKDVVMDRNNWIAGVTVALVSVPLSISLGIASGTTPMRGIACAIFGGLCAGIFGSSDYNIVGPAGALSGMLSSYVVQWGEDCLPWISLISAVICFICLALRLDVYMLLMPNSVFEGFTVAVAVIIGLNQINFACGLVGLKKHKLFVANIYESIINLDETKPASLIVFLISAPLLWFLMRKIPKIPWTVILPIISIPLGFLSDKDVIGFELLTLKSKYGMLKPEIVQPLRSSDATFVDLLIPSFSVAIVAVLETLISAKIAAGRVDRDFSELGEMRGLVIAHAVCGVTGGMPPTGVFVRTSLNTSLGCTHRFSQTLNACVVAIISLALMPVFSYLPQATIAAILVVAAIRMTPRMYLLKLWNEDKGALALCLVTAAVCVGEDPVIGLAVGMVIALLAAASKLQQSPFVDIKEKPSGTKKAYSVSLLGALTYINAEKFMLKTRKLEDAAEVSLDLSGLRQVDHDGMCSVGKLTEKWVKTNEDCKVYIRGVSEKLYPFLTKFAWFTTAEDQGRVIK